MKQLMVSIPEPCHENWDGMSPTEQGRFCNACSKEVIDFSTMSDAQMVLYFSKLTTEKVCGRVYPDQLNRTMAAPELIKKKKWYWNYLALFLLFFSKSSQTKAQGGMKFIETAPIKKLPQKTDSIVNPIIKEPANLPQHLYSAGGLSLTIANVSIVTLPLHTTTLIVKDDKTNKPISNASIVIKNYDDSKTETALTDKNGKHKIKKIKTDETYFIKVIAEGYANNEFTMSEADFEGRKTNKEIYLTKKNDTVIRFRGGMSFVNLDKAPIYVLDGTIIPDNKNIDPNDLEDISILQGPAAAALFGPQGMNGAIVMTTKKAAYKILDTVKISSEVRRRLVGQMTMTSTTFSCKTVGLTIYTGKENTKGANDIEKPNTVKLYPNPVPKGNAITLSFKLKKTGNYTVRVTSVAGAVLLQRKFNAASKDQQQVIESDSRWSSGVYYVWVLDENNALTNSSSFIVQ
jgi:hypothetical protein